MWRKAVPYSWLRYIEISCSAWVIKKDIEKILLLRKGVMCYEYIDSWDKYI